MFDFGKRHALLSLPLCMLAPTLAAQTVLTASDLASLRAAITTANGSGDYVINISATTIALTGAALENANASGDLDITKSSGNLTINGASTSTTIIDGGALDRVFHINASSGVTVTFTNITIRNGRANDNGTAVTEARGAGIYVQSTTNVTLTNVALNANVAQGNAGANGGAGATGLTGVQARGGAVYYTAGSLSITGCTFSANAANGGNGGNGGNGANATASTFASASIVGQGGGMGGPGGNGQGGAVYMAGGTVSLSAATLGSNTARGGVGGLGGNGGNGKYAYFSSPANGVGGAGGGGGSGGLSAGGAIYVASGGMTVTASTLSGNATTGGGGGRGGDGGNGTYTPSLNGYAYGGNGSPGGAGGACLGGALFVSGGTLSLVNSTLSGNSGTAGNGGAGGAGGDAFNYGPAQSLEYGGDGGDGGNSGTARGGGIYVGGGTATVNNSTITLGAFTLGTGGTGGAKGAGYSSASASSGSAGSVQQAQGGGCYITIGTLTMNSALVANNTVGGGGTGPDINGAVTANNCLIRTPAGATISGTGNVLNQDPLLVGLANNGGPTLTHAIPQTSPAVNVGSNPGALTTDQRGSGYVRSSGAGVDIGAFEYQLTPPAQPSVTVPAAAVTVNSNNYSIQGTAPADMLVRVYGDTNNNNTIDTGEVVVATQQLTGGATAFSVSTPLTQNTANNFLVTAYSAATTLQSSPADVPTITEDSNAPGQPTVTTPASATITNATTFNIQGTAEADALVRVYRDLNNNNVIDPGDTVAGQQQLTGGATAFSASVTLTVNGANNFLVTATDVAANQSTVTDVPTIIQDANVPAAPVVTDPASAISVMAANYNVQGTCEANALVKIYRDLNNNNTVDTGEPMVGSLQLTGGAITWAVIAPLTVSSANNFVATATDAAGNESAAGDVPTITENTPSPTPVPTVTAPSAPVTINAATYNIDGTAIANALVRIYNDANNNGAIDTGEVVVAQQQLTGGQTLYSIAAPIVQNSPNNFVVTAQGSAMAESAPPVNVPTITDDSGVSGGSGSDGGGGGCSASQTYWGGFLALIAGVLFTLRAALGRPQRD